nr:hypothetical protein [uncultured Pseudodesulfovibrio sp.]
MIWLQHDKYTHEYSAFKMAEIFRHVRGSTRCMAYVAGGAVVLMSMVQVSCIYGL